MVNAGRPNYSAIAGNQRYAITIDTAPVSTTHSTLIGVAFSVQSKTITGLTVTGIPNETTSSCC